MGGSDPTAGAPAAGLRRPLRRLPAGWLPVWIHRGLPSRHLTFLASIGDPIHVVAQTDPRQPPRRYDFVLGGLQATPALIAQGGSEEGIAIELTPLGCRALLGMPARALWNTTLEAHDVVGRAAAELRERLHDLRGWATASPLATRCWRGWPYPALRSLPLSERRGGSSWARAERSR